LSIYEYREYKPFLLDLIRTYPKAGRGQARKLSEHLAVNSVVVSQILAGDRHFTPEQSLKVAHFFGLDERATDYLVLLVNFARAGSKDLEAHYEKKLEKLRREILNLKNRVVEHRELNDPEKGIFYSNWFYSGIRLLSSIEGYKSVEAIAGYFGLSRAKVADVISFLLSMGLCKEQKDGKITIGTTATYVDAASPFVNSHRRNWRMKALERFSEIRDGDLFYSGPYSLSQKDADHIRKELAKLVAECSKRVADSPAEKLYCLNVDWFEF
jgi:uncharacterized protein (TIGR02147 family)